MLIGVTSKLDDSPYQLSQRGMTLCQSTQSVGIPHRHHDICLSLRCLRDSPHRGSVHSSLLAPACVGHATATAMATAAVIVPAQPNPVCMPPTVPASLLLGVHLQTAHRLPFSFCPCGAFLSRPPPFCPIPSLAVSLFTVKPAGLPIDFPVSLSWSQGATGAETEPLCRALEGFYC